ncbi:MAG: nickel pincer cofactor biosynthesis protein LarC [Phycisphaerae bacterium]
MMIAYLDAASGISGDMFLGCLVDAGVKLETLRGIIAALKLPVQEWSIDVREVKKGPLRAAQVLVHAAEGHTHRHLSHIQSLIASADLPTLVKERAIAVFHRLADAEARVHGSTPEKVHFHEVGAVDAIIDIVGVVAGLNELGVKSLYASALPLAHGWVDTQHGRMALPAPATLELLTAVHAPTRPAPAEGEWVTPTGAALLAELAVFEQPEMTLARIGVGAGVKEAPWPNVARLWLGENVDSGSMVQIETNIDDMNPQLFGPVMENLLAAGAADVWLTPVQMKKNRPGVVLCVLAPAILEVQMIEILLQQTTTLGVRVHALAHRHEAGRAVREVCTQYGTVRMKIKLLEGRPAGATPEFEDCRRLADQHGVPVRVVLEAAWAAGRMSD